ncbi:MAG TPA: methyltransferase [Humibacter sp.]|nr:methyltransferase [Humibacter sp.]
MPEFAFEALRRRPDVEAANLFASDAADRLLLQTAADALSAPGRSIGDGSVTVIDDGYGALTIGAAALHGARGIRVHQDSIVAERALAANAGRLGHADAYHSHPLDAALLAGSRVVLLRLPKSLDALDEIAATVAAHAAPDVTVFAGAMVKHLTPAMNDVLGRHFGGVQAGLARQKARVLTATAPGRGTAAAEATERHWPACTFHDDVGVWVCAHGGAFAGVKLDIGTRFLLNVLDQAKPAAATAIDLGCGTGVLAAVLAMRRPGIQVLATDQSAAAIASAQATAQANGVADRVQTQRDDALSMRADASADLVVLNPPFHLGTSVHAGAGLKLIEAAGRVLRPGGELWTVFNSHLGYRAALGRCVGPTRQIARNAKFTVTVSTKA